MKCNTNEADKLDLAWLLKPPERPPKIAKPTIFLVDFAGYWGKFSISNNHASVNPHRLRYCHCAKMTTQPDQLAFTTSNCQNTSESCHVFYYMLQEIMTRNMFLGWSLTMQVCEGTETMKMTSGWWQIRSVARIIWRGVRKFHGGAC